MISAIARLRAKKGFTLIEIIVVIAIIGILTAMIIPSLTYDQKPALGKALAKDVYYTAQDALSTVEITNPKAITSGFVCFYAQLNNYGQVTASGVANPVVGGAGDGGAHNAAVSYSTFDSLISGTGTDEQKAMYSKMQTALSKYVTEKEGMEGYVYIVTDTTFKVIASYWMNVDANGTDVSLQDNCITGGGDYCCSYPVRFCNGGEVFYTSAESSVTTT
ncbi:MAG: prepilin-type N-terminal cleavage/methylation domain-containing protein [Ruminiclostridium sp.]|nr:prepilin-type N-terminal cleavage/methylation domain-containing protein [Ruminiclostridium sp.]